MSRYIDAEWLKGQINTTFWAEIGKIIDNAQTIDIVRCKECKFCTPNVCIERRSDGYENIVNICNKHTDEMIVALDDFCSYGERSDND